MSEPSRTERSLLEEQTGLGHRYMAGSAVDVPGAGVPATAN